MDRAKQVMNIAILHKEKESPATIERQCKLFPCKVSSFSLLEKPVEHVMLHDFDIIIFDTTGSRGENNDRHIIKFLREKNRTTPIFLSTSEQEDAVYREKMFDAGVDGGIQTPFSSEELFLRLNKLFVKRLNLRFDGTTIATQDISLDIRNHTVEKGGERVPLTKTEYGILFHLFVHKKDLVHPEDLSPYLHGVSSNDSAALNIHILNLRKKLKNQTVIKTIPYYGFSVI
jgi:DNA-binding response OmpR family regulator